MLLWHAKVVLLKVQGLARLVAWLASCEWHATTVLRSFSDSVVGLNTLFKALRDDENRNQFVYNSGSSASKITQQDHNASKQTYKSTLKSGTPERCERSRTY